MNKSAVTLVTCALVLGVGTVGTTSVAAADPAQSEHVASQQNNNLPRVEVQVVNNTGAQLHYGDTIEAFTVLPNAHRWHTPDNSVSTLTFGDTLIAALSSWRGSPHIQCGSVVKSMGDGSEVSFKVDGKWDVRVKRLSNTDKVRFQYDVRTRS